MMKKITSFLYSFLKEKIVNIQALFAFLIINLLFFCSLFQTQSAKADIKIEPDEINSYKISIIPSDTYFTNQWYLKKIKAPEAWDQKRESEEIVLAIIDTGIEISHPDLKDNIWVNRKEIINNNTDDDKNGYVDDVSGWDFINNTPDPAPKFKEGFTQDGILHGTVIAGIAAAAGNNAAGITGVSWSTKIMALKALDDKGEGNTSNVVKAINYAIDNKADIINLSFVGQNYSHNLEKAIARAYKNNIVVVAAAGNEHQDDFGSFLDKSPLYPVCYDGNNYENMVLGVTATDAMDQKTPFAAYSFRYVDIASPGVGIYSTSVYRPEKSIGQNSFNKYYDGYWSGTSMAVPMVSGAVALIESTNPYLSRQEVIEILLSNTDNLNRLNPTYLGQLGRGRLNIEAAVSTAYDRISSLKFDLAITMTTSSETMIKTINKKGVLKKEISVYPKFRGKISVASGDTDGDGTNEIITAPGQGGGPHIKILDTEGKIKGQFFSYAQNFRGGVNITAGDVDGDGKDEVITAPASGGGPHIKIFSGQGKLKNQFLAYAQNFRGGVNITAGDVDGDGKDEVITAPASGGGPHIKIFSGQGILNGQFLAYSGSFRQGVNLATADIDRRVRSHKFEIITSPAQGLSPEIKIFDDHGALVKSFLAFNQKFKNGVSIAGVDSNLDGIDEIAAAAGPGGAPHVRIFNPDGKIIESFYAYPENYNSGINIFTLKN